MDLANNSMQRCRPWHVLRVTLTPPSSTRVPPRAYSPQRRSGTDPYRGKAFPTRSVFTFPPPDLLKASSSEGGEGEGMWWTKIRRR
jgi:hypothetical protein